MDGKPENHRKPWSDREVFLLKELYSTCDLQEVANTLKRTVKSVRNKAWRENISERRQFTDEEVRQIKEWYASRDGTPLKVHKLAEKMGRSRSSIYSKARKLGVTNPTRREFEGRERDDDGLYLVRDEHGRVVGRKKFRTAEEAQEHSAAALLEWRAENGHPRGMAGKTHTEAVRRRVAEATRKRYEEMTAEEASEEALRAVRTRIERYGTAGPVNVSNPYSRTNGGKRDDLGGQFFRSSWEANYARYLNLLEEQGEIRSWGYEEEEFWFDGIKRGTRSYTPDFRVTWPDGSIEYHEVKGWMDQKSKTRLKRMERYHPNVEIVLIDKDAYVEIRDKLAGVIEEWETNDL